MSRTVTALFANRSEAEAARAKLASDVKVESARVLARDTVAALDGLSLDPQKVKACREALQRGDHLLVATVARGEKPAHIINSLRTATPVEPESDEPKLSYDIGAVPGADQRSGNQGSETFETTAAVPQIVTAAEPAGGEPAKKESAAAVVAATASMPEAIRQEPTETVASTPHEATERPPEVRIGNQRVARGTSGEGGSNSASPNEFESRAPARRLTDEEVQAGGLLKDRVIEVVEMREEPVIAKEVVVREEVVIRKTVKERSEAIEETVRRTEFEVEQLP